MSSGEERPYEKWPGYWAVRQKLEVFQKLMRPRGPSMGYVVMDFIPTGQSLSVVYRVFARDVQMIFPETRKQLEGCEDRFAVDFQPVGDDDKALLKRFIVQDFAPVAIHFFSMWAYTGVPGEVSCVYDSMSPNPTFGEITLQSIGVDVHEFGLTVGGNVADSLLVNTNLKQIMPPQVFAGTDSPPEE